MLVSSVCIDRVFHKDKVTIYGFMMKNEYFLAFASYKFVGERVNPKSIRNIEYEVSQENK